MSEFDGNTVLAGLPPRQRDVVNHIINLTEENGYPPTLAELAAALGLKNRMTVHQHVAALKKKGLVHWEPGLNRSLKVVGEAQDFVQRGKSMSAIVDMESRRPNGLPLAGTFKEKTGFRLQPANSQMEPIYVESANDLQVQGTVVALFRKL
jgi:SOS-response transcriptional repressor LexA